MADIYFLTPARLIYSWISGMNKLCRQVFEINIGLKSYFEWWPVAERASLIAC